MARKEQVEVIHPRKAIAAIEGFHSDANYLLTMARNLHSFMTDDNLDKAKVCAVGAVQLKEAIDRVGRWYDAD